MRPRTGLIIRLAVTLLVIFTLFRFVDLSLVVDRLRLLRPIFLAVIFALVLAQNVLFAIRWSFIADFCSASIGIALAIRFTIISMFFNSVGEGVSVKRAFLGVVIDRILALIVLIGMVAASLPLLAVSIVQPHLVYGMAVLAGALLSGIGVFAALPVLVPKPWRHWRPVRVLLELSRVTSAVLVDRRLIALAVPPAVLGHLFSGGVVVLCALAMNIVLDPIFAVILMLPTLLAMSIPISIAGWGVREGAMVIALGQVGVRPADALALSVAFGLIYMIAGIPGGVLWLIPRQRRMPAAVHAPTIHAKDEETI
jgi:uncharacterized membrane protein YbhN (UPF0104 family)